MLQAGFIDGPLLAWCGQPVALPPRRSTLRLLLWLLVHRGDPDSRRARIAQDLWPELEAGRASLRLSRDLHWLQSHLAAIDPHQTWLRRDPQFLELAPELPCRLDVAPLLAQESPFAWGTLAAVGRLPDVLLAAPTTLLRGWDEPWLEGFRDRLERGRKRALERLVDEALAADRFGEAIIALRALCLNPAELAGAGMRLLRLQVLVADDAGARDTQALLAALGLPDAGGDPGMADGDGGRAAGTAGAAPADSGPLDAVRHRPLYLDRLIGRTEDLRRLADHLATERIVTIVGPGGVGKTRLATELTAGSSRRVKDSVFCELAALRDGSWLGAAILHALGGRMAPAQPVIAGIVACMEERDRLLLLDNCEHVLDAVRQLVSALAAAYPPLRVLATSRSALGLPGELVYRLAPLSHAADGGTRTRSEHPPERPAASSPAASLFLERAAMARPGFQPTDADVQAAERIGAALEGLPLAVELAAARAASLTATEIEAQLAAMPALLADGSLARPGRQRSLEQLIDWSLDLLPALEREDFLRLAVFSGPFTVAAAADVIGRPAVDAADLLDELAARSLLERHGAIGDGASRHRLLEPVRQHAWRQLPPAERARSGRRHAMHYLAWLQGLRPQLEDVGHGQALDAIDEDKANIYGALTWAAEAPDAAAVGLDLAESLASFWRNRSTLEWESTWVEGWLRGHGRDADARSRARACRLAGELQAWAGHLETAETHFRTGLAAAREAEDASLQGSILNRLAQNAVNLGQLTRAEDLVGEARLLLDVERDPYERILAQLVLGQITIADGRLEEARQVLEDALARVRQAPDHRFREQLSALWWLASVSERLGALPRAEALLREGITLAEAAGYRQSAHKLRNLLGIVLCWQGRHEEGRALYLQYLVYARSIHSGTEVMNALGNLADVALHTRNYHEAISLGRRALAAAVQAGDQDARTNTTLTLLEAELEARPGEDHAERERQLERLLEEPIVDDIACWARRSLARSRARRGDQAAAWTLLRSIVQTQHVHRWWADLAMTLDVWADVAAEAGRADAFALLSAAALDLRRTLGSGRSPHELAILERDRSRLARDRAEPEATDGGPAALDAICGGTHPLLNWTA